MTLDDSIQAFRLRVLATEETITNPSRCSVMSRQSSASRRTTIAQGTARVTEFPARPSSCQSGHDEANLSQLDASVQPGGRATVARPTCDLIARTSDRCRSPASAVIQQHPNLPCDAPATSPSTSRIRSPYRSHPPLPSTLVRARGRSAPLLSAIFSSAWAMAAGSRGGTMKPSCPSVNRSSAPVLLEAITGQPQASASPIT